MDSLLEGERKNGKFCMKATSDSINPRSNNVQSATEFWLIIFHLHIGVVL